jgi:hypothetical protein
MYEVLRPVYGNPSSPRALHKTMDAFLRERVLTLLALKNRYGGDQQAASIWMIFMCQHM